LRAFRRLTIASRSAPNYKLAFSDEQWIFNYAYIAFAWALVIIGGVRPACDDVPLEIARTFRNVTTGAAEALEAMALGEPVDTDRVEDHLDAETLRAQEILHPEDFKPTRPFKTDVAG
jgi:hypothetical protein